MLAWPSHKASDNNIIEWRADSRLGVCLICREFRAIDIDISDEGKALEVEGAIREFLGIPGLKMPLRTRQGSGKRALLYRIASSSDTAERYALMHQAETLLMQTGAVCPHYWSEKLADA